MPPLTLDSLVVPSEEAVSRDLDGEAVILDLATNRYFGLDQVGARVWCLVEGHGHLRTVFNTMLAEYNVTPERLEQDLMELVRTLVDRGLLRVV